MCSFLQKNDLVFFYSVVFEFDDPTHNPSSVRILSLLIQFSGLTTLQSLVLGEAWLGALTKLDMVFEE